MSDTDQHARLACRAERVFDGEKVLADGAVLVEGATVRDVVPASQIPAGWPVIEEPGATIIPGVIDAHVHFMRWQGPLYLAAGVTTLRAATSETARRLRFPSVGRMAPGYDADIVFVAGNVAERLPEEPQISAVLRAGRLYRPAELLAAAQRDDSDPDCDPWGVEFRHMAQKR